MSLRKGLAPELSPAELLKSQDMVKSISPQWQPAVYICKEKDFIQYRILPVIPYSILVYEVVWCGKVCQGP